MVPRGEGTDRCGGSGAGSGGFGGCARSWIHTSQLFRWRQQLCKRAPAPVAFNPVAVAPVQEAVALALPSPSPEQAGTVEIEFATGGRMRITGSVDASTVSALIKALAKTKRRR